jgi:hypothetical protein
MDPQPLLIILKLRRTSTKKSYHGHPGSTSIDPTSLAAQLPHRADAGTITGWIPDETVATTPLSICKELEQGCNCLADNILYTLNAGYDNVMRRMTDEVINSDTLITYLTAQCSAGNCGSFDCWLQCGVWRK